MGSSSNCWPWVAGEHTGLGPETKEGRGHRQRGSWVMKGSLWRSDLSLESSQAYVVSRVTGNRILARFPPGTYTIPELRRDPTL